MFCDTNNNRGREKKRSEINLKLSISVAIVSSSVFDELLGIPYPACIYLIFGWVEGGVNIGAASGVRFGKTTPDLCHSYNPRQYDDDIINAIFYHVLKM